MHVGPSGASRLSTTTPPVIAFACDTLTSWHGLGGFGPLAPALSLLAPAGVRPGWTFGACPFVCVWLADEALAPAPGPAWIEAWPTSGLLGTVVGCAA